MTLYAESSAVLAWLMDGAEGSRVRELLSGAEAVVASDLTLIECDRVVIRAAVLGELTEADAADRRAYLTTAASHWHVLRIGPEVVDRARQPFPNEPIRTLDALHLASALFARSVLPGLAMLTLDDRIRKPAARLGMAIHPEYVP
jgi:predicted nucleic acid-binding protein